MIKMLTFLASVAGPAVAQGYAVPSGLEVTLFDVITEEDSLIARYRFVAPDINIAAFDDVVDDFQILCETVALPQLEWTTGDVVISYSAQELRFGDIAPEVTQFFQPFSIQDGRCIWEEH